MVAIRKMLLTVGALALMAAPVLAQGGRGMMAGAGGMGGPALLSNSGLRKELKVTDAQAPKLDAVVEELQSKNRERSEGLRDLPQDERREKMQAMMKEGQAEMHKSLATVLKPEQMHRFEQIQIQMQGPAAFAMPKVQEKLALNPKQKGAIQKMVQHSAETVREAMQGFQDDREGSMKKIEEVRKETLVKIAHELNEKQKESWKDLVGSHFEFKPEMRRQP